MAVSAQSGERFGGCVRRNEDARAHVQVVIDQTRSGSTHRLAKEDDTAAVVTQSWMKCIRVGFAEYHAAIAPGPMRHRGVDVADKNITAWVIYSGCGGHHDANEGDMTAINIGCGLMRPTDRRPARRIQRS